MILLKHTYCDDVHLHDLVSYTVFPKDVILFMWTATLVDMLFYTLAQEVSDHGTLVINILQFARKM